MKVLFRIFLLMSLMLNLILVSSYRDSVQISNNYTYQPAVVPTGIVNKVDWSDTWTYFRESTLTRVLCHYRRTQVCDFSLPANAPSNILTNFYSLQVSENQLPIPANSVAALDSLENGNLIVAQRSGDLYRVDLETNFIEKVYSLKSNQSDSKSTFIKGPLFGVNEALGLGIRDIFIDKAPDQMRMFYTYTQVDSFGCLSMNFESIEFENSDGYQYNWKNRRVIWNTENECLRFSDAHILGAGGKIEKISPTQFLVSLGDLNLIDNRIQKSVWGNIFLVNSETRDAKVFTSGHRNPSGIVTTKDGRIFQVEQGPQGGDEINQLKLGTDYGWPTSTFGKNYTFGGYRAGENIHEFGKEPLMAFVPSPAFSSISTFQKKAPKLWMNSRGVPDLFVTSLKGSSIYRCRLDAMKEAINYCERIFLRERLRDIVLSSNDNKFKIFVLTDRSSLITINIRKLVNL